VRFDWLTTRSVVKPAAVTDALHTLGTDATTGVGVKIGCSANALWPRQVLREDATDPDADRQH
jgi:hypothetical protein